MCRVANCGTPRRRQIEDLSSGVEVEDVEVEEAEELDVEVETVEKVQTNGHGGSGENFWDKVMDDSEEETKVEQLGFDVDENTVKTAGTKGGTKKTSKFSSRNIRNPKSSPGRLSATFKESPVCLTGTKSFR